LSTKIIVAVAFAGMVVVNYLSTSLPLGGITPDGVSDKFPTLFTPAGYVFSIWGLIYVLLAGLVIYSFVSGSSRRIDRIAPLFVLSCALNTAWLFAWHWILLPLSLAIMVALLLTLILIVQRLREADTPPSTGEKWLVHLPFSIYLGWISVATIANASAVLYEAGWDGWGLTPEAWTVLLMSAAIILGVASVLMRGDFAYTLVIVWALVGIGVRHSDYPPLSFAGLTATSWMGAAALLLFMAWRLAVARSSRDVRSG